MGVRVYLFDARCECVICREQLTINMPSLECRHSSSEEDILSTDELESVDGADGGGQYEEYAITFDLPGTPNKYPVMRLRVMNAKRNIKTNILPIVCNVFGATFLPLCPERMQCTYL